MIASTDATSLGRAATVAAAVALGTACAAACSHGDALRPATSGAGDDESGSPRVVTPGSLSVMHNVDDSGGGITPQFSCGACGLRRYESALRGL